MTGDLDRIDYVLGNSDHEHDRLIRQARTLSRCTEQLFRDAGLKPGHRVLDIGSGMGDVAILAASIVAPTGSVLGLDRDEVTLRKARVRLKESAVSNVRFLCGDVDSVPDEAPVDAIVGRFILMYVKDPTSTLTTLFDRLRVGGVLVMQEPCWHTFRALARDLPLHLACANLICDTLRQGGAEPDMALPLYRALKSIDPSTLCLRVDTPLLEVPEDRGWLSDLVLTVLTRAKAFEMDISAIGDPASLRQRLEVECRDANSHMPLSGLVGGWIRKRG